MIYLLLYSDIDFIFSFPSFLSKGIRSLNSSQNHGGIQFPITNQYQVSPESRDGMRNGNEPKDENGKGKSNDLSLTADV